MDYVLSEFTQDEKKTIDKAVENAADAVEFILDEGYPKAMEKFNSSQ